MACSRTRAASVSAQKYAKPAKRRRVQYRYVYRYVRLLLLPFQNANIQLQIFRVGSPPRFFEIRP